MTSFTNKVRLSLFGLLVFGLCFVGCKNTDNEAPETKATDTTAIEDTETVEATPSTPATADFSTVQVVDEARFWEEVCEYDGSRYGFKNRVPAIIDFYADFIDKSVCAAVNRCLAFGFGTDLAGCVNFGYRFVA